MPALPFALLRQSGILVFDVTSENLLRGYYTGACDRLQKLSSSLGVEEGQISPLGILAPCLDSRSNNRADMKAQDRTLPEITRRGSHPDRVGAEYTAPAS